MTDIIDAHCHFWTLSRGDYSWLTPEYPALFRDFAPADMLPFLGRLRVKGVVAVQAAATEAETAFLIALASHHSFIRGVVGWTDLLSPAAPDQVEAMVSIYGRTLKGFRFAPDEVGSRGPAESCLGASLRAMARHNLVLDFLSSSPGPHDVREMLNAAPELRIVLNHAGLPHAGAEALNRWRNSLRGMADMPSVFCKLSGLTNPELSLQDGDIDAVMEHTLEVFGSERLMWGSDWPVLCLASQYTDWLARCRKTLESLSAAAQQRIFFDNAARVYGLFSSGLKPR